MRFTILKEEFLKHLTIANHAIGSRTAIPTLQNFKIEMKANQMEITSSGDAMSILTVIPVSENGKEIIRNSSLGAALLNAKTTIEIVNKLEGDEITVEIIDNRVAKIDNGHNATYRIMIPYTASEYPDIDLEKTGTSFSLPAPLLATIAEQTSFAALDKDTRRILTAINLKAEDGKLIATATDSARLSRKEVEVDVGASFSVNIPAKTLLDITKIFAGNAEIELCITNDKAIFESGTTTISTRLESGSYPVQNSIIPQHFNYFLQVNAMELSKAISALSTVASGKASVIVLSMDANKVEASASGENSDSGIHRLKTFVYNGERLDIAFNGSFVTDAIKALGSEDVTMSFIGEMKPFVIRNPEDDTLVELITPMRTPR